MSNEQYMVKAPVFLDWWTKLVEQQQVDPDDAKAFRLLYWLDEIGRRSGATNLRIQGQEGMPGTGWPVTYRSIPDPQFDWHDGEVDFGMRESHLGVHPDLLIADLENKTGIRNQNGTPAGLLITVEGF